MSGFVLQKKQLEVKPKSPPKREMMRLDDSAVSWKVYWKLVSGFEQFIRETNQLIDEYNKKDNDADRIAILKDINNKVNQFECKYPASYLAASSDYRKSKATLFQEIKYQSASMGIATLTDPQINPTAKSSPVAEIIANMSQAKADALLNILAKGKQNGLGSQLKALYAKSDLSDEAKAFRDFLNTHEISYLGGGNSKNFKVTRLTDGHVSVLKVDSRLDMPRDVEVHLREKAPHLFNGIDFERVSFARDKNSGGDISRTLVVTEFCQGGSVDDYRNNIHDPDELAESAGKIFEQMANAFIEIDKAGCLFPDAKITNWLVDSKGKVLIADTKSFQYTDGKYYDSSLAKNEYYNGLAHTRGFVPPELFNNPHEADKVHSYLLGKNLYIYVTGKYENGSDAQKFDFDFPIFKTAHGEQYKQLIQDLVKPKSADRIPVATALQTLKSLNIIVSSNEFAELEALKFGKKDKVMQKFIDDKKQEIMKADTPEKRDAVLKEVKDMVTALNSNKGIVDVKHIADDFRHQAGIFSIGKNAKAKRIEEAVSHMTLEERCNFFKSEHRAEVLEALASRRSLINNGKVYRTSSGDIDETKLVSILSVWETTPCLN